jgi:hypothetical protein
VPSLFDREASSDTASIGSDHKDFEVGRHHQIFSLVQRTK